jgi:hypothetical protein
MQLILLVVVFLLVILEELVLILVYHAASWLVLVGQERMTTREGAGRIQEE